MLARTTLLTALAVLLLGACEEAGPPPVHPLWDPGAGELGAFPDDAYTVDDPASRTGLRPDVTPERIPFLATTVPVFQDIFRDLGTLDGFGLTGGIYLRFDGALDKAVLLTGESTASAESPVLLVVEGESGPELWPYELEVTDEDMTLLLLPMRPLPPRARVFAAVTTRVLGADGRAVAAGPAMRAALDGEPAEAVAARVSERMQRAADSLVTLGAVATVDEVAAVVVFTTQSVHEDALAVAADVAARDIVPLPGTVCFTEQAWVRCEGKFVAIDYRGDNRVVEEIGVGGRVLETAKTWEVPFTAWLPLTRPGPFGGTAFPTLIFGHGLGGERQQAERLASFAAAQGLATIAIDALRHGGHPTAKNSVTLLRVLDFFAIDAAAGTIEPLEMRDNFRQSAWDRLQLTRMLVLGLDLDGDGVADLDPARLGYLGVSLGGIMGPELLALAPEIGAGILVVPGARVGYIVRDAPQFAPIVAAMKPANASDGDIVRFFPILQTLLDRGDPVAWAPLLGDGPRPDGVLPAAPHLLAGMVLDDDTVPNSTNRVLVRALGMPVVPPIRAGEIGLVAMTGPAPVSANAADGRTVGLLQFDTIDEGAGPTPATHSNIGDSPEGVLAWLRFIETWLNDGVPVIVDPYAELGR
ncbi:MAG: hypothetical protein EXR73_03655 [Myxococcales bacterium]|nr:hypothetical protein [Myxococcales bacterium]